ncbi:metalloprotease TIKI1-like [Amphiura filiformis]|uniref:metalloprotease TIKI1-like n=1 Tax=Amphiura filiformis TaxID=82378 RepID=UPI003B211468
MACSPRSLPPAYFFGTIHVPYTRVWDYIPDNAKQAFRNSENIFFELDLTDTYTISTLSNCQLLPHGDNLSNVLPNSLFQRLERHLEYVRVMMPTWMTEQQKGRGLYADYLFNAIAGNWQRKRPVWIMLMVNSLTETDIKSRGIPVLDLYLAQEAMRSNKRTGAVERVEEQCIPLNGLNFTQVLFALNQTLWQQESIRSGHHQRAYTTEDLIWHYNCGDLNSVIFKHDTAQVPNLLNTTVAANDISLAQEIDEYFREELIFKRNRRMASRVEEILNAYPNKSFFFAFGAGHFLGNYTVIELLKKKGFVIENIPVHEAVEGSAEEEAEVDLSWLREAEDLHNRRRDRNKNGRRRKKKKKNNEDDDGRPQQQQPQQQPVQPHRQFNDLWIPLEKISTNPPLPLDGDTLTTVATRLVSSSNAYSLYFSNSRCSVCQPCTILLFCSYLLVQILYRLIQR